MAKRELITDEKWLVLKPKFEKSVADFHGNVEVLEGAWGTLLVATQFGWKVAFVMHSQATIKKYEKITGIKFRDVCEPETALSGKSIGYKIASKLSSIWKAIRGEESIPHRGELSIK